MQRYGFFIEYEGKPFSGWQLQKNKPTVQGVLQEALFKLTQQDTFFYGAGRTDRGVHALCQVAHADFETKRNIREIHLGLNFYLKSFPVRILQVFKTHPQFHARFSASHRHYRYVLLNRSSESPVYKGRCWWVQHPLDMGAMKEAAFLLQGTHNFQHFRSSHCQANSSIRTLDTFSLDRQGDKIVASLKACSFLHHQVRFLMGSVVAIGKKKWTLSDLRQRLQELSHGHELSSPPPGTLNHSLCPTPLAPAHGLYFFQVDYPSCWNIPSWTPLFLDC